MPKKLGLDCTKPRPTARELRYRESVSLLIVAVMFAFAAALAIEQMLVIAGWY